MSDTFASFGMGGWYPRGVNRLRTSLEPFGYPLYAPTDYPDGCPTHQMVPYAFKPHVVRQAAQHYRRVLWADSSVWVQHNPKPLFDIIKRDGVLLFNNAGQCNGHWCSDRQLKAYGFSRDEAMLQPHGNAAVMGFDFDHPRGVDVFEQWEANIDLFRGRWRNEQQTESTDPRCIGSRHDQSVISLIAAKDGIAMTEPGDLLSFDVSNRKVIVLMQGM